jgi:5-methyltetrahydrofolate--homocysteine methyltransferase
VDDEQIIERIGDQLSRRTWLGDAVPKFWPNFGPGIIAAFLGAEVGARPETVWFEPPADCRDQSIEALTLRYDADNPWWQKVQWYTQQAVDRWGGDLAVSHTDLGGNLDILSSFRTAENLLFDCVDSPQEVERLVGEITQLWMRYYDELLAIISPGGRGTTPWAPIWSTGQCYMLQCDFAYMISPEMFERFVLPDLQACCAKLDQSMYHLDGKGQLAHLDSLLAMEDLDGIQWIPGEGNPPPASKAWHEVQGRVLKAGKRIQTFGSPEDILELVRAVGGKGVLACVWANMTPEQVEDFIRTVEREALKA